RRPDLVETGGERDDAVARDRAVRGPEPDDPAERGWLLDRAARVRAERPRREAARDGRSGAAPRAAGDARRVPGVVRRPEGRVLRGRAHRELVRVRLAEERQARVLAAGGDRRVVDGPVAGEDLRARGGLDPLRADHVLERDRDSVALRLLDDAEVRMQ